MTQLNSHTKSGLLDKVWSLSAREVIDKLQSDAEKGLSVYEAQKRLLQYGHNLLREHRPKNAFLIFVAQFKSIIIILLAAAAGVAFWFEDPIEGFAISVVILINTLIGFFVEWRAVRSMEALYRLGRVKTRVRRENRSFDVDASHLVPGDIVIFEGGDIITADLRIIKGSRLQADESTLTGESLPVSKHEDSVIDDTVLAERSSMLFKGTALTRGAGTGIVVATGLNTELGKISSLMEETVDEQTPLEKRLDKLGYRLIWLTLLITFFVALSGVWSGKDLFLMIETGIALAVAAIPEGLPIVATIALAKGMRIMAGKNALINRLASVETLGATGIICTDKTGTLTQNKMTVTHIVVGGKKISSDANGTFRLDGKIINPLEDADLSLALLTGVLCNNAFLSGENESEETGDPLEIALLLVARKAMLQAAELHDVYPEVRQEAFDPEKKMMATWNQIEKDQYRVHVKGAPSVVLKACSSFISEGKVGAMHEQDRQSWIKINEELASSGFRVIALAIKNTDTITGDSCENLSWVGLVALQDPPRPDVKLAIEKCRSAGIRVVMITGDQVETARYIAKTIGLHDGGEVEVIHGRNLPSKEELVAGSPVGDSILRASIFARISPAQKLSLIEFYQQNNYIVAMTGDGVNDAPALKKADIGIAMGRRGTQVARESADVVLTDDAFSTIVAAIEQGRVIFGNIRRFIYYLMSCNVSEVLVVGIASVSGAPLPVLPLQILFLNLVTDVFPALALGVGEGETGIMKQKPQKAEEPLLDGRLWKLILLYGSVITACVMGVLLISLEILHLNQRSAVTHSFLTLALIQLWHVFNMRSRNSTFLDSIVLRNPWVWGALFLCLGLILLAIYFPPLATVLQLTPPDFYGWLTVLVISLIPVALGQFGKALPSQR